jgi:hypothetical protein
MAELDLHQGLQHDFSSPFAGKHRFVLEDGTEVEPKPRSWADGADHARFEVLRTTMQRGSTSNDPEDEYEPEFVIFTHTIRRTTIL